MRMAANHAPTKPTCCSSTTCFDGTPLVARKVEALKEGRHGPQLAHLGRHGGGGRRNFPRVDYMKSRLGRKDKRRPVWRASKRCETNRGGPSTSWQQGETLAVDDRRWWHHGRGPAGEADQIKPSECRARQPRSKGRAKPAIYAPPPPKVGNVMEPSIAAAKAASQRREMGGNMRSVHGGEYAGPQVSHSGPVEQEPKGWTTLRDAG